MLNQNKLVCLLFLAVLTNLTYANDLAVGPEQPFTRIEEALTRAVAGDTILVYPRPDNQPYDRVALNVSQQRISIKAVRMDRKERIPLSGQGYDYSGWGTTPRAIVQFSQGSDGSYLEGFELFAAHNRTRNGAGIRIDRANHITIRDCTIHDNDMGIMSNGDGTAQKAVNQRIEGCLIYANGDLNQPGYSHNLYLGGTSVTLVGSEIHGSLTGHNIKSRAHRTVIMACYIHDSANRELDLVDAEGDTDIPNSNVVLAGNIIVKSKASSGNRQVIHFGRDGDSQRNGTLFLIHNNIITPFGAPVIHLSSPLAKVQMFNTIVWDSSQTGKQQVLAETVDTPDNQKIISGGGNWLSGSFAGMDTHQFDLQYSFLAPKNATPGWADLSNNDYRLLGNDPTLVDKGLVLPSEAVKAMSIKLRYYTPPQGTHERSYDEKPDIGAYALAAQ